MSANTQLITNLFSMHNAQDFANSFSSANNTYYVFAGRHYPFVGGDANVSQPSGSYSNENFNLYQDMIFGKKVNSTDVKMTIRRIDWVSGTVYDKYNNNDALLMDKNFYVGVTSGSYYDVFKCLDNNFEGPSTSVPTKADTSESDNFYQTADGYRWKYMFSVSSANMNKFSTSQFVPVIPNANVVGNAVPGAIDVIEVISTGNGYTNYVTGSFNSTSEIQVGGNNLVYQISSNASTIDTLYSGCYLYITSGTAQGEFSEIYTSNSNINGKFIQLKNGLASAPAPGDSYEISPKVLIFGDGNQTINAVARALITGSAVTGIQMIGNNPGGEGYGYATASVYASPYVGLNPAYAANINPIISPVEGHGGNPQEELFSKSVCVGITFANTESNTVYATSSFRNVGLIRSP